MLFSASIHGITLQLFFFRWSAIVDMWYIFIYYHGIASPSQKNPPVGPSSDNVAARTIPFAPFCTGRPPRPPVSVATHPGSTEFTNMPVFVSSAASFLVNTFNAAFETL